MVVPYLSEDKLVTRMSRPNSLLGNCDKLVTCQTSDMRDHPTLIGTGRSPDLAVRESLVVIEHDEHFEFF